MAGLLARTAVYDKMGTGLICTTWALEAAVIPAKAGIHSANPRKCAVGGLDSRFRGNDGRFERDPIANDTNATKCHIRGERRDPT